MKLRLSPLQPADGTGGDFLAFCAQRLQSSSSFKAIRIDEPFTLRVKPHLAVASAASSPAYEGVLTFVMHEENRLQFVPLKPTAYDPDHPFDPIYRLVLSSIAKGSLFLPIKARKQISVVFVPHPFVPLSLALRAVDLLPNGTIDWVRDVGGVTAVEIAEGASTRWGSIRAFGCNPRAREALWPDADVVGAYSATKKAKAQKEQIGIKTAESDPPAVQLGLSISDLTFEEFVACIEPFMSSVSSVSHGLRYFEILFRSYHVRATGQVQLGMTALEWAQIGIDSSAVAASHPEEIELVRIREAVLIIYQALQLQQLEKEQVRNLEVSSKMIQRCMDSIYKIIGDMPGFFTKGLAPIDPTTVDSLFESASLSGHLTPAVMSHSKPSTPHRDKKKAKE